MAQWCERALGRYDILERDDWQNHRDWQRFALHERQQGLVGDEPFLEGTVAPAACDPNVTGAQAVAQFG